MNDVRCGGCLRDKEEVFGVVLFFLQSVLENARAGECGLMSINGARPAERLRHPPSFHVVLLLPLKRSLHDVALAMSNGRRIGTLCGHG